jgi:hypothetical protein
MPPVTYQTIKLSKGKHASPEDGACVMELASMLAGERFGDHPDSVCPVIGSFLRTYNDFVDDERRQDLYAYAAQVVGSRAPSHVQWARAERLKAWATENLRRRWTRLMLPPRLRAIRRLGNPPIEAIGVHAVHSIQRPSDRTHAEVLALIDELLLIGAATPAPAATGAATPAPAATGAATPAPAATAAQARAAQVDAGV